MDEKRWEEMVRAWLREAHGPVLALDIENIPQDLQARAIRVTPDNAMACVHLVARGAPCMFYDPGKCLDSAVVDKMLVVRGFGSEEKKGTRGS